MDASRHRYAFHSMWCALLAWTGIASAQTLSSGSTGVDGAFMPGCSPTPCTVTVPLPPDGVFNYTTVDVPTGVTVLYTRNAANTPVTILAAEDVTIAGSININGNDGTSAANSGTVRKPGSLGGPGGFDGGWGAITGGPSASAGLGPGGGPPACCGATFGAPNTFISLIPLFGGSGGGGGNYTVGGGGAGGGGAIVIASSGSIVVTGSITANSGLQGANLGTCGSGGLGGSGGAIRLVARSITGTGSLSARGTPSGSCWGSGDGRIRLEAFTLGFTGTVAPGGSPGFTQSNAPGPVTAAGIPGLLALPSLAIASVGSVNAPAMPGASFTAADVTLPQEITNPVTVVLSLRNMPVGSPTAMSLKLIPNGGAVTTISIPAVSHTGTFASSTATTDVTLPLGQVSMLQAWATTTLSGEIARLFPLIDGEPVEQIALAAGGDGTSLLQLVTSSGKERRLDQLPVDERRLIAHAWQALRNTASQ
jgi:hypothetical protein